MKAIVIDRFGGPEELVAREMPEPEVGPDSVLIAARAAGVNPVDFKIRQGHLEGAFPHHFPLIGGWDVAGVVEAVGPAVGGFAVGDEVYAYCRKTEIAAGTYAERVAVPDTFVAHKPRELSWVEAAAVPLAGLTARQALVDRMEVATGQTVLVTAAAGGVGHLAVQLARSLGAEVIGTASEANHDYVRSLGAAAVIDYAGDVAATVREHYPDGVDAAFDLYGGDTLAGAVAATRESGQVTSIADPEPAKGASVHGHYVFVRPDRLGLEDLTWRADAGELRPEIAEVFPLDRAAEAHERLEGGHVRGKLVLEIA
jgi:NADPH:quinone reductase-like Zn-dependent oxidoreductase